MGERTAKREGESRRTGSEAIVHYRMY